MKRLIFFLLLICLAALGIGFAVLNAGDVELNYYLGSLSIPLAMLVVGSLFVGAFLGGMICSGMVLMQRRENSKLRRRMENCEKELKNLRQIPIKEHH